MAHRRHSTTGYDTYGSAAYAPIYDGSAVRVPRRDEERYTPPRPQHTQRVRQEKLTRTQAQVREAGEIAPFAVVGFLAVAVLTALLLLSYTQSTVLNAQVVSLRNQLSGLETEHATLSAQYERVFDMETIEAAVGETMIRPTKDQAVYIDLSEPDTVVVYNKAEESALVTALKNVGQALGEMVEYFR